MNEPVIQIGSVENIYLRVMHFEKVGCVERGHSHPYDHLTTLASGSLRITVDGKDSAFKAPHLIFIQKNKEHMLTALEDNTVAICTHVLRSKETGIILDPSMIPEGINPLLYSEPLISGPRPT